MSGALIFISYTSKDGISKAVSKRLFEHLDANCEGINPWRDKDRLTKGEQWNKSLAQTLVSAHAGVLLLTKKALTSSWVHKEATYMALRAQTDPDYKFIPVLLGGFKIEDIADTSFDSLGIQEFETIKSDSDQQVFTEVEKALKGVRNLWQRRPNETLLVEDIAAYLDDLSQELLLRLARQLELDLKDWFPIGTLRESLKLEVARHLTTCSPVETAKALRQVMGHLKEGAAGEILSLTCAFRVSGPGARTLAEVAREDVPPSSAAINAEDPKIGRRYVWRASGSMTYWDCEELKLRFNPEGDGDDLVQATKEFLLNPDFGFDESEFEEGGPVPDVPFVLLWHGPISEEILTKLQVSFQHFVFFLFDNNYSPESRLFDGKKTAFLNPRLKDDEEMEIIRQENRAQGHLDRATEQIRRIGRGA